MEPTNDHTNPTWPRGLKFTLLIFFILIVVSLGLNLFLIWQLMQVQQRAAGVVSDVRPAVATAFAEVDTELAAFQQSSLTFNVQIDQKLPIQIEIPFNETVEIPVQTAIPIQQQLDTTIMMDPFQAGLEIPVDISVPIDMEFPIDETFEVVIDRTIPVSATLPISLTVPLSVAVSETDFAPYIQRLRDGLISLEAAINQTLSAIGP